MSGRATIAVALHDGFYGCGTGAGYANYGFLEALVNLLPHEVRLAVLPVWLSPSGSEHHPEWHAQTRQLLAGDNVTVHPVHNGTGGMDRWGELANFRQLVRHTAEQIRTNLMGAAEPLLVIAFDAPFLGLPEFLPPAARRQLVLVPRSSALIHAETDTARVEWERAGIHAGLADGTRVATISRFMQTHLRQDYGVPGRALIPLRDGLSDWDWQHLTGPGDPANERFPPSLEFLLSMGRAEPYKGFDDLLEAIAILRRRTRSVPHLVLAATAEQATVTPYQQALAARVRALHIDATLLTAFTPAVQRLLRHPGLRGVIVPSRREPFGRIPTEAFAAGAAPVVVTTAGGLADQIVEGITGFRCPPNSPVDLADALGRALDLSYSERTAMRHRARERALHDHDQTGAVRHFLEATAPWLPLPRADDQLRWLASATPPVETRSAVSAESPVKVPIGLQAPHWNTIQPNRLVLIIVHHVTSLIRLLDVITIFDADPRVQVVFSKAGSDPFQHGVDDLLRTIGATTIPWSQAIDTHFDLAIAANHGGLTEITAPIVVLSHGIGYAKNSPGNRKPETGNRKPETGNRSVFGLSPEWLLYDGRPIAASLILSHEEQRDRLAAITPTALSTAVVAGDPVYDRMLRSRHLRARYREALGVTQDQKLVAISTTWWKRSLLGSWPSLYRELISCLPSDEYRFAGLIHPNISYGHGPWQVQTWLADCTRAGLVIAAQVDGWAATLIASDLVVGDHGAVTCYGAALGVPTLLASFPDEDVAAGSAVELLGRLAPRLNRHQTLSAQVRAAIAKHEPDRFAGVRELVSSWPGEAAVRLRRLCYEHLDLAEPDGEPPVLALPVESMSALSRPSVRADHVVCTIDDPIGGIATITRYPADVSTDRATAGFLDSAHLVVHEDHPKRALLDEATVVLVTCASGDDPDERTADALRQFPGAALAAAVSTASCLVRTRDGARITLHCAEPAVAASLIRVWTLASRAVTALPATVTVSMGSRQVSVRTGSVAMVESIA